LGVSYGLSFAQAALFYKHRLILSRLPELIGFVTGQTLNLLIWGPLIYFVSSGRYLARLIYAVLVCLHAATFIPRALAGWPDTVLVNLMAVISIGCECLAMYWLFTEPGRRWFKR
jgi:hypothetical protein